MYHRVDVLLSSALGQNIDKSVYRADNYDHYSDHLQRMHRQLGDKMENLPVMRYNSIKKHFFTSVSSTDHGV